MKIVSVEQKTKPRIVGYRHTDSGSIWLFGISESRDIYLSNVEYPSPSRISRNALASKSCYEPIYAGTQITIEV